MQRVSSLLPGPSFPISPDRVKILTGDGPSAFLECIQERAAAAKRRVTLSSLYLGHSGKEDQRLLESLKAARSSSESPKLTFLFDRWRGSRGPVSSVDALAPLALGAGKDQVRVGLFRIPALSTWASPSAAASVNRLARLSPVALDSLTSGLEGQVNWCRLRELLGVQHLKLGIFDDSVLITGANLSQDYFSTRSDRYILVENQPELADRLSELVDLMVESPYSRLFSSSGVAPSFSMTPEARPSLCDPLSFGAEVDRLLRKPLETTPASISGAGNTVLHLLPQFPGFGLRTDSRVTSELIRKLGDSKLYLSSPYLNANEEVLGALRARAGSPPVFLTGSDRANGFHGASGAVGMVPQLYRRAAESMRAQLGPSDIRTWDRAGWTFHSKGLWFEPEGAAPWTLSLIGSSNFGNRSANLDSELQFALLTEDAGLKARLREEREGLLAWSSTQGPGQEPMPTDLSSFVFPVMKRFM